MFRIQIAILSALGSLILMVTSFIVGALIFDCNIDTSYPQYNLVGQGKLVEGIDCVGNRIMSIGGMPIVNGIRTYSSFDKGHAREFLKGVGCEYKVYNGWYWGVGDFYYITPK